MTLIGDRFTQKNVSLERYTHIITDRVSEAFDRGRSFIDTRDLRPPELTERIHASLEGITVRSDVMHHTYPFTDPSSRFLIEALTGFGYVAHPENHFSTGRNRYTAIDHNRFNSFEKGFNTHMHGHYRIIPYDEIHRNGRVLCVVPNTGREPDPSDPNHRATIPPTYRTPLEQLETLARTLREIRSG